MDAVLLSWVATSYLLAAAMFLVPFGKLADIEGRKKLFIYGIWIYTISSLLCAVAWSEFTLIGFRVIQGIGSSMIFGTAVAILTSVFPPGERGRALGISVAAVYLGLSVGPSAGGVLTHHLGWRSVFYVNVPLGLLIIWFVQWQLRGEWAGARGERLDYAGSILYGASLFAIMFGFSRLPDLTGWIVLGGGLVLLIAFIARQLRVENPVINMGLFVRNTVFAFSNLAALINYSATFAVAFLLSLYLQYVIGYDAQQAGLVLVAQPVVMAIFSPFAGRLSDRVEPRIVASIGMSLTVVGLVLLIFLEADTGLPYIITSLMILGLGFALFSSPNTNAIMSAVEKRNYGVASATVATMRLIGQVMSMGIAMLVFAVIIGRVEITHEHSDEFLRSSRIAFIIFSALCTLGIFASLARGRMHAKPEDKNLTG